MKLIEKTDLYRALRRAGLPHASQYYLFETRFPQSVFFVGKARLIDLDQIPALVIPDHIRNSQIIKASVQQLKREIENLFREWQG